MSNPSNRPAKRQRAAPQEMKIESGPSPKYQHHAQLWFDDGNLVVVAESDPLPTAFKIYRGILTKQSATLSARLDAVDNELQYLGAPILSLDDPAPYVEGMLNWVFMKASGSMPPSSVGLMAVFGFYQLGLKYGINAMHEYGLNRLEVCYPSTLDAFRSRPEEDDSNNPITCPPSLDESLEVSAFAGRHKLYAIAAVALYDSCATANLADQLAKLDVISQKDLRIDNIPVPRWTLKKLLTGYPSLCSTRSSLIHSLIDPLDPISTCKTKDSCRAALHNISEALFKTYQASALRFLYDEGRRKPCARCWEHCTTKWSGARQKIWDELPSYFDLPERQ